MSESRQPTVEELREHVERRSLQLQAKLLETQAGWFDNWQDPREYLYDTPDFWYPIGPGEQLPPNLDSRGRGEVLPLYLTEHGLKMMRDQSRRLLAYNEFAINAVENRVSYLVGKGFQYRAVPKGKALARPEDDPLCEQAQAVLDDFIERNEWGQLEQEVVRRVDRDGEVFLRLFSGGEGEVRVVEPEHVRTPPQATPEQQFGVENPPGDVEGRVAYHVVENPSTDAFTTTPVPADEIVHIALNVDRNAKRGVPTTFPVRKNLERAEKLLRNMSVLSQVQASFALLRKHKNKAASAVDTFQRASADVSVNDPITGGTRRLKNYAPGTILDVDGDTEYEFPAAQSSAAAMVQVLQAELRAVASRLVMPEYMLTADASNANYASTLVAEAPSTRNFERLQSMYARHFGDGRYCKGRKCGLMWRVLKLAVDEGRLPAEVLTEVEIQAEGPTLVARDKGAETNRAKTLRDAGILSDGTWAKWEGLDHEQEQRQGARRSDAGAGGMPTGAVLSGAAGDEGPPDGGGDDDLFGLSALLAEAQLQEAGFTGTVKDKLGREYHYVDGVRTKAPDGARDSHLSWADRAASREHGRQHKAATKERRAALAKAAKSAEDKADRLAARVAVTAIGAPSLHDERPDVDALFDTARGIDSGLGDDGEWKTNAGRAQELFALRKAAAKVLSGLATMDVSRLSDGERQQHVATVKAIRQIGARAAQAAMLFVGAGRARAEIVKLKTVKESWGRWLAEAGFTGTVKDKLGREYRYVDGERVAVHGGDPTRQDLKGADRKAQVAHLGQLAKAGARIAASAGAGVKQRIDAATGRLPAEVRAPVANAWHAVHGVLMALNHSAQALAEETGRAKGLAPEAVARLAKTLAAVDIAGQTSAYAAIGAAVAIPGLHGLAIPAKAMTYVPVGSISYLLFSSATSPVATLKAAAATLRTRFPGAVKGGLSFLYKAARHPLTHAAQHAHEAEGDDLRRRVAEALADRMRHGDAEEYLAYFSLALDATRDPDKALQMADELSGREEDAAEDVGRPGLVRRLWRTVRQFLAREDEGKVTGPHRDRNGRTFYTVVRNGHPVRVKSRQDAAKVAAPSRSPQDAHRQQKDRGDVFRKVVASHHPGLTADADSAVAMVRKVARLGRRAGAGNDAVNEAVAAALLGHHLQSHGTHGFDTEGSFRGKPLLIDAKHASAAVGYDDALRTKLAKVKEWKAKGGIPAYLAVVEGHGVYLHVGIDPAGRASIGGKRPVVEPGELGKKVDGSGGAVPFVKVADWKGLRRIENATADEVDAFRDRVNQALESLDMDKTQQHVTKQVEEYDDKLIQEVVEYNPDKVADKLTEEQLLAALQRKRGSR